MIYSDFLDTDELKAYVKSINSRAKSLEKSGRITVAKLRDRIYASGGKCEYCTESIVKKPFEIDHIHSLSGGGDNAADNLAVACPECNRAKSSKHPARFVQEIYARTGKMTLLLQRVLDLYEVSAAVQKSMFDTETEDEHPTVAPLTDEAPDNPPPYVWGKNHADDDPPPYIWKTSSD